jgi:hypothetical protein
MGTTCWYINFFLPVSRKKIMGPNMRVRAITRINTQKIADRNKKILIRATLVVTTPLRID